MDAVWDCPARVCAREVIGLMASDLAYTTVATVLGNLVDKGLVERIRDGRRWVYRPLLSREEYAAALMARALTGSRDRATALRHLVSRLHPDDAAALAEALTPR